jgi:hypothetical protein
MIPRRSPTTGSRIRTLRSKFDYFREIDSAATVHACPRFV